MAILARKTLIKWFVFNFCYSLIIPAFFPVLNALCFCTLITALMYSGSLKLSSYAFIVCFLLYFIHDFLPIITSNFKMMSSESVTEWWFASVLSIEWASSDISIPTVSLLFPKVLFFLIRLALIAFFNFFHCSEFKWFSTRYLIL